MNRYSSVMPRQSSERAESAWRSVASSCWTAQASSSAGAGERPAAPAGVAALRRFGETYGVGVPAPAAKPG